MINYGDYWKDAETGKYYTTGILGEVIEIVPTSAEGFFKSKNGNLSFMFGNEKQLQCILDNTRILQVEFN